MTVIRVNKNRNFVTISNVGVRDSRLSWKAKGILVYLLSLPDDWKVYMSELEKHASDGEKSLRSGFAELKKFGYVERIPVRQGGKIVEWETVINEIPSEDKKNKANNNKVVNPKKTNEKPINNTERVNNNTSQEDSNLKDYGENTENVEETKKQEPQKLEVVKKENRFVEFWKTYPRKVGKKKAQVKYEHVIKKYDEQMILDNLKVFVELHEVKKTAKSYIPHATTYLSGELFDNDSTKEFKSEIDSLKGVKPTNQYTKVSQPEPRYKPFDLSRIK